MSFIVLTFIFIGFMIYLFKKSIVVVPRNQIYIIEIFGQTAASWGPGLHSMVPLIQRVAYKLPKSALDRDCPIQPGTSWNDYLKEHNIPHDSNTLLSDLNSIFNLNIHTDNSDDDDDDDTEDLVSHTNQNSQNKSHNDSVNSSAPKIDDDPYKVDMNRF